MGAWFKAGGGVSPGVFLQSGRLGQAASMGRPIFKAAQERGLPSDGGMSGQLKSVPPTA